MATTQILSPQDAMSRLPILPPVNLDFVPVPVFNASIDMVLDAFESLGWDDIGIATATAISIAVLMQLPWHVTQPAFRDARYAALDRLTAYSAIRKGREDDETLHLWFASQIAESVIGTAHSIDRPYPLQLVKGRN